MEKIGFVFPGQGAQAPGMGQALYEASPAARAVFAAADALRPGTSEQCFSGTMEELTRTENTQPCMFTVELAAWAALREAGVEPAAAAGFSLGEIAALTATGAVTFEDGVRLVQARGRFMQDDADSADSAMAAVLKLDDETVEGLCAKYDHVYPVNYNCPGQVSCAALREELAPFMADVKAAGGRAMPLKVAGGFHSPFMANAAGRLGEYLRDVELREPSVPLYSDCTALPYDWDFRDLLSRQVCSPVRWKELVANMAAAGVDTFIEVGPGKTLCGLIKKTLPEARAFAVCDPDSLAETLKEL